MDEFEIAWQVFGVKTVVADSADDAHAVVCQWLRGVHGMTSDVIDGWDFKTMDVR